MPNTMLIARYNRHARHEEVWNESSLPITGDASTDTWLIALFLRRIHPDPNKKTEVLYLTEEQVIQTS